MKERKKRHKSFVRRRETPTEVAYHAVEVCRDSRATQRSCFAEEYRKRQVIEIPAVPVRIIEHVIMARRCGVCGRRHIPKLDLSQEVIGIHRVGVRLMSLVACLHISGRIPIRTIQKFLSMVYGLHISTGELVEILHAVADADGDEPQRVLAQRIEKFLEELFMFVEYPEVPSENNSAERAIRPAVVARKISGGTRSDKGSATKMTLMSLFGTWAAQGVNPLETCRKMLVTSAPA